MVVGTVYVTAPAAAAAMGLYFFGRNFSNNHGGGGGGMGIPATGMVADEKKDETSGNAKAPTPKLAPQFDGLFCFETIVSR
ncbi:Avr9/Cf-9 rapidly elicited protein [Perilla frutescens var. hirtella]|uniref:Avr9/Cf-9 rapidly elicited protein n=1 Tax=Perilla frutescens var. hirtella TaxID=608512 RepID=A0AAD4J7B1_PERFH|nr:Avr9/Cf-9 rapidly elicited protein [Perilla frutescens var. hirtella]